MKPNQKNEKKTQATITIIFYDSLNVVYFDDCEGTYFYLFLKKSEIDYRFLPFYRVAENIMSQRISK